MGERKFFFKESILPDILYILQYLFILLYHMRLICLTFVLTLPII